MEVPEQEYVHLYPDGHEAAVLHRLLTEETICLPAVRGGWSLHFDQSGAGWVSSSQQCVWVAELLDLRVAKLSSGFVVIGQGSQVSLPEFKREQSEKKSLSKH